jgi:hypothetical protein
MDYIWGVKMSGNPLVDQSLKNRIIKNPATLTITVGDYPHGKQSKYSRWEKSCYELAERMITGAYNGGKARPFMFYAMQALKKNKQLKRTAKFYMTSKSGRGGGITVDWEGLGIAMTYEVQQLLTRGQLGLTPLDKRTISKREKAGHSANPPLVASGELAKAITFKVNGA